MAEGLATDLAGAPGANRQRSVWINAVICAVVAGLIILSIHFGGRLMDRMELSMGDFVSADRGLSEVADELVLIGIDEASLNLLDLLEEDVINAHPHLYAMSFGYPFPRSVYAAMAQKLIDAGARLVVFDMLFIGEKEGDAELKAVIEANPGKVVVGCDLIAEEVTETNTAAMKAKFNLPSESVVVSDDPLDPRIGYVNYFQDSDGKVRGMLPMMRAFPHEEAPARHSLAFAALKQLGEAGRITQPFDEHFARFPEFDLEEQPYSPLPFYTLFMDHDWEFSYRKGEAFRDKIVYIGGTSIPSFHDQVAIPETTVLGAQLQMATLAAALDGDFYAVAGKGVQIALVLAMAAAVFGIAFVMRRPILGMLLLLGCGVAYLAIVSALYFWQSYLLPSAAPMMTLGLAGLSCFGSRFAIEQLEKARLRRTLERQVSKELADHILSMPEGYFESGVRKPVTVLFSDIRSFTARSEKDDPAQLVLQLKEYLDAMVELVFEHGGMVDKFIGDAVMAVWGNLHTEGAREDSRAAVATAVAMQKRLAELNEGWRQRGFEPFEVGIGLNHGEAIFGMMGSEHKQEMTVIGDPVNQAARLESLTKKFGVPIVVGARVAEYVRDQFALRSLGKVQTLGKREAEELSAVVGGQDEDAVIAQASWLRRYHAALEAFERGDLDAAKGGFDVCQEERADDRTVAMYLDAITDGAEGRVLVMKDK